MTTDLKELLARVVKATGADRALDVSFAERFDNVTPGGSFSGGLYYAPDGRGGTGCPRIEQYTASLDAALALKGRIAPEWRVELTEGADYWVASLISDVDAYSEPAPTAPLALLKALLKALLAKENDRG